MFSVPELTVYTGLSLSSLTNPETSRVSPLDGGVIGCDARHNELPERSLEKFSPQLSVRDPEPPVPLRFESKKMR
jgi:hypothetical protein